MRSYAKAVTEKVAVRNHPERAAIGGSRLCRRPVKTIPELQHGRGGRFVKCCRVPALKDRICWNLK